MKLETLMALLALVLFATMFYCAFGPALDHSMEYRGGLTHEQRQEIVGRWEE